MNIRYTYPVIGAAVLCCATANAQTTTPQETTTAEQSTTTVEQTSTQGQSVTLVGCLQTEADYRRAQDAGRGGVAMTGAGLGNEYVLIQTEGAAGPGGYDASANAECKSSTAFAGTAYELTGDREADLKQFVGRRIEITGEMKHADDYGRPGGFDPAVVSSDLRLQEVNVASFREQPMATQTTAGTTESQTQQSPQAAAQPEASQSQEAQPQTAASQVESQPPSQAAQSQAQSQPAQRETIGTSGQADQAQPTGTIASADNALPGTASPLGLAGLLGLLSLGGGVVLRFARS